MKFAFVTTNLRGGGAEKAMLKYASLLADRGHETHLILLENRIEHAVPPSVNVTALTDSGQSASKGLLGRLILAWRLKRQIARLASQTPVDLIVSTLPFADEICRRARLPRLWHRIANTLSAEIERLAISNPRKAMRRRDKYRRLYDQARLITVSDGVTVDLQQLGIVTRRAERIYNPFDADHIRLAAREEAKLPPTPFVIHVGRFSAQKRHDILLAACRHLPESHQLVLLCHDEPELRALISHHKMEHRVVIAGFQPNPYPWIAAADMLVLCSDHEGMPNVLIEALLLGTPVVSTDCPSGPREVLESGRFGQLVACGDASALATAINRQLSGNFTTPVFDPTPFLPNVVAERLENFAQEPN